MMDNLWSATAPDISPFPRLEGSLTADVAIIGGGFTGLSAALHLAEAGKSVVLLEARIMGYGGSGRNVGLINAGLWTPPDEVEVELGKEAGQKLNGVLAGAPAYVMALIEKYNIDCELTKTGTLHCAHSAKGFADLEARFAQQKARKAPVTLLSREEASVRLGTSLFHGALHDARAGTLQPLSYARGLAKAAGGAGAQLFEDSEVTACTPEGAGWQLHTREGTVTARHVIEATNAYECQIDTPRYTPVYYFQCATDPVPEDLREGILPGREGCWDTAMVMTSFRWDKAGRMIVGGVGKLDAPGEGAHLKWAARKLAQIFPTLTGQKFSHGWHGRIAMTGDHVPKIVQTGNSKISVFGYSGRGIGPGTVFGKAAADWILREDTSVFPVTPVSGYKEKRSRVMEAYYQAGAVAAHLTGARR